MDYEWTNIFVLNCSRRFWVMKEKRTFLGKWIIIWLLMMSVLYSIKNTSSQFQKMVQPTQAWGYSILYLYSIRSEFFKYQILSLWYYQDFLTQKKNVILKCTNRIFSHKRLGFFHKRLGFLHRRLGFFHKDKNRSI